MLKQKAKLFALSLYITELILLICAFFAAFQIRDLYLSEKYGTLYPMRDYLWLIMVILPLWSLLFYYFELYESQRTKPFWMEAWKMAKVSFLGTLFLTAIVFIIKAHYISRLFIIFYGLISLIFLILGRLFLRMIIRNARRRGYNYRNIIIIGTGRRTREIARIIEDYKDWGLRLIGIVCDNRGDCLPKVGRYPVIGNINQIAEVLQHQVVDEVIFAVSRKKLEEMEEIFLMCEELGIRARVAVNFFPHMIAKVHLDEMHGIPLLTFTTTPYNEFLLAVKRTFDLVVSNILLVLLSPLFLFIAITIKATSPGPILFKQIRLGLNGRRFTLYKFRSMVEDAESKKQELLNLNEMDGPVFKIKDDPRLTLIGRFLRRTSLDEFPQLINVLKGNMSIVGPRPPLPEEVANYKPRQRRRLSMKPGLTCLWQIKGRNRIRDFNKWMELDLWYIDNWSLKLDFKIFLKTITVVVLGRGAS